MRSRAGGPGARGRHGHLWASSSGAEFRFAIAALAWPRIMLYVDDQTICTPKGVHQPVARPTGVPGVPEARAARERGQPPGRWPGQITPKETPMSTAPAVTMQDLELEHAELLPSRETLSVHSSFTQVGYGNTAQAGLVNISALNGSANNILSLGSGNIVW